LQSSLVGVDKGKLFNTIAGQRVCGALAEACNAVLAFYLLCYRLFASHNNAKIVTNKNVPDPASVISATPESILDMVIFVANFHPMVLDVVLS